MKLSSPDAAAVRPAKLDRPLSRGALGSLSDPRLQAGLAEAIEQAREAALAEGYAAGWALGSKAAAERADAAERARQAEVATGRQSLAKHAKPLLTALAEAARRQQRAALPAWDEVADALADGALAIAAGALDRELRTVDAPVVEALKAALRALSGQEVVAIRLHPDDAAMLDPDVVPDGVRLVPDAEVPRGGVLAQTPAQRLLMHLPAALAAAEEVLRS
jgi:flagellar biosynthesis/type III secretory pathway protein FliH